MNTTQTQLPLTTASLEYDNLRLTRETVDHVLVARFSVPGEPVSKSRARFTKRGSKTMVYTPEKTRVGEQMVAALFRQASGPWKPEADPAFGVAASFVSGTRQRRDVDNMLKLILDGLNGVAWVDDLQVTEISGRKELGTKETARTDVAIYIVGEVELRLATCEGCGKDYRTFPSWQKMAKRFCSWDCHVLEGQSQRMRNCLHCEIAFDPGRRECRSGATFCSPSCVSNYRRVSVQCFTCRVEFTKQLHHVKPVNHCSDACSRAYQRSKPTRLPKGLCLTCGGPTSRKEYVRCQACKTAASKVKGNPQVSGRVRGVGVV